MIVVDMIVVLFRYFYFQHVSNSDFLQRQFFTLGVLHEIRQKLLIRRS